MAKQKSKKRPVQQQMEQPPLHAIETPVHHTMPIDQQVHLTAGIFILLGLVLGYALTPWFYVLPLIVGIGLLSSGLTGYCTMSAILREMPWNQ